jgi:arginyl-tRNA synthetase
MAESAYNEALPGIIEHLRSAQLLQESDGAQCVFLDEFKGKEGDPLPVIVQKSDGGYLYATTDLAAIAHRSQTLKADRVMVFTDARQVLHFRQIYAVAKAAGLDSANVSLEHYPFGAMLGRDGKPFKTREGGVVKLSDLLDEACERGRKAVLDAGQISVAEQIEDAASAIGIGAVKYADLSKNRTSDYVFDWDAMMSFDGNTAPYLQYAYARIQSIFTRGEVSPSEAATLQVTALTEPAEHQLAATLLRLQEVVEQSVAEGMPHYLCTYLYEVASRFMTFYEACPILKSQGGVRESRLALSRHTGAVLHGGLDLLGIKTVDRM